MLHGFGAPGDGSLASSGLALGNDGILYGTTAAGGAYGNGTVFSLAPPLAVGGAWTETVLYSLGERADDGAQPYGTPALGEHGVLYATTTKGGPNVCSQGNCGTVFSLTPPSSPGGAWTESILYAFRALDDGDYPSGTLSIGHDGSLYGTTLLGGESGFGTAFRLRLPRHRMASGRRPFSIHLGVGRTALARPETWHWVRGPSIMGLPSRQSIRLHPPQPRAPLGPTPFSPTICFLPMPAWR